MQEPGLDPLGICSVFWRDSSGPTTSAAVCQFEVEGQSSPTVRDGPGLVKYTLKVHFPLSVG